MPFACIRDGVITPLHHAMTKPYRAMSDPKFSFKNFSLDELCSLPCDSYDLILCTDKEAVEIAGGDQRINTVDLQLEAIDKLGLPRSRYAFLLEALCLNETKKPPHTMAGFAFGLERVAMLLAGNLHSIDQVQIYPTNHPNGELIHAYGVKYD